MKVQKSRAERAMMQTKSKESQVLHQSTPTMISIKRQKLKNQSKPTGRRKKQD